MQSLCNRAGTAVATAAVAAAFESSREIYKPFAKFAMVLQGNAISQFIGTTYGTFSSPDLMDDLVGLVTSTAAGTALLDRLNSRIHKQKRYKNRARDAIRQVYTPTEAVRLVLELEMPKKR